MGEIANEISDGLRCEACGDWMPEYILQATNKKLCRIILQPDNVPGYPSTCLNCLKKEKRLGKK